jgi:uncharacterized protein (TIGR00297 family)
MGLFALLLRWLDWRAAAVLAAAALLFNVFVMPRIGRGIYRDRSRRTDPGIVAYPAMVFLLVLLFRHDLAAAAALWGMMALGDPAASIAGRLLGGPALPWNRGKRWSGLIAYFLAGTAAAAALWMWVARPRTGWGNELAVLVPVVVLGAFLESIESGLDDNWLPPVPCALLLAYEQGAMQGPPLDLPAPGWAAAVGVNAAIGFVTYRLRIVARSGAVAGALVGSAVLAFGGWAHYVLLWTFFLLGTLATALGYRRKNALGTAQAARGRRGARHVVANCAVAALLCLLGSFASPEWTRWLSAGLAGALAAALADTLGTEVGSLYGARPISLLSFRAVSPGTPGAVSLAGLAGGAAGALAVAGVAGAVGLVPWGMLWIVTFAGIAGSLAESLVADGARLRRLRVEHEFANAFNTFVGAIVALELAASMAAGRLLVPFESVRI